MRQRMTDPITWEPPLDPPVDALETLIDKLEGFFEEEGYAPRSVDDVAWAMHRLGLLVDRETGEIKLLDDELEEVFDAVTEWLDGYFDEPLEEGIAA